MTLTLLFDLDDTLLDTNLGDFVPAYFQALAKHLSPRVKPDDMLPALTAGTRLMMENIDPTKTLQTVFESVFYPRLGVEKATIRDAIEDFYDKVFPTLGKLTHPREGARELVAWALQRGYRLAVATDPLFPRKAILERIRWAGLDPRVFALISSYETFHFTKSHPAYFAEVLGRLGWPDGPVLMVGNDEERDLARAEELGLKTYQVNAPAVVVSGGAGIAARDIDPAGHGTLTDLRGWLEQTDLAGLEPDFKHRAAILAILRSTPAVLDGLASGLTEAGWRHEPTPEDWALIEIICHLRDTEREVHHEQLHILMKDAQPFVPRPDAAVWAKQRNYLDENGPDAVAGFAAARLTTLGVLQKVAPEIWSRGARHAIFGPTDFTEVLGFMANHDRLHIQQAWQTLKAPG